VGWWAVGGGLWAVGGGRRVQAWPLPCAPPSDPLESVSGVPRRKAARPPRRPRPSAPPRPTRRWIQLPGKWGGAIELSILAAHYGREVAAYDVQTKRCDVYGQGRGYGERVMVIYDGLHYDAIAVAAFEGAPRARPGPGPGPPGNAAPWPPGPAAL
jgi:hypothetical protein